MEQDRIKQIIEEIAETIVLFELSDRDAVLELMDKFILINEWSVESNYPELSSAAEHAIDLLKDIPDEPAGFQKTINVLVKIISGFQAVIIDRRDVNEAEFPPEIRTLNKQTAKQDSLPDKSENTNLINGYPFTLPSHIDKAIFVDFLARQAGVLENMEELLLALEKSEDSGKLAELKRQYHTLKGEAALLGLTDVEKVCHASEAFLDQGGFSMKKLPAGGRSEWIDRLLSVKDWLGQAFSFYEGKRGKSVAVEEILDKISKVSLEAREAVSEEADIPEDTGPSDRNEVYDLSLLSEDSDSSGFEGDLALIGDFISEAFEHLNEAEIQLLSLETDSDDKESLNAVFRAFHTIKGVAEFLGLREIAALAHEEESLLDRIRKGSLPLSGIAVDITFDAIDALKRLVKNVETAIANNIPAKKDNSLPELLSRIRSISAGEVPAEYEETIQDVGPGKKLGEILVETGAVSRENIDKILHEQKENTSKSRLGERLVQDGSVPAKTVAHALRGQKAALDDKNLKKKVERAGLQKFSSGVLIKEAVKVDADRLDRLVDTIGELVIAEAMVSQLARQAEDDPTELVRRLNQLDKITRELQEMGTSLRMVPVRSTFQKMARLVRDLARKAGKKVHFFMSGEDTELDKTVVDQIGDPLIHMVRNAVDHGLESSAEERRELGKPDGGRVDLRAFHKGGNIYIEVEDDGRGLDREAILNKARERGLIQDGHAMSDRDVFNLIFEPGFSTAKKVTAVSGRGVGMDVVRKTVEALRGQVEIYSEKGKGSAFTIRLPLTLAIIDGMIIRVSTERYIIPTLSIVRTIRPNEKDLSTVLKRGELFVEQGELIPLFRLGRLFDLENWEADPMKALIVVVEDEGRHAGLLVDELMGQQQIVIKSLGDSMRGITGISGGAVMPDGRVGLILDVGGVVRLAHSAENARGWQHVEYSITETGG
jgi:two-component system chemotaxis sensor kinase CheA